MTVRFKRSLLFVGSIVLVIALLGCGGGGGGKYADLKKAMRGVTGATKSFAEDVEKASDGKGIAEALQKYVKEMEKLQPQMEQLEKKYPELSEGVPEELKELEAEFEEVGTKMMEVMGKLVQFADDPEVLKAMESFEKIGQ